MIKKLLLWLINICLSAFFISCENDDSASIGLKPENSLLNTQIIDTFDIKLQTVFEQEKIISEGTGILLAGTFDDPLVGKSTASSFFQLVPQADIDFESSPTCNSVTLYLNVNSINTTNDGVTEKIYSFYGDSSNVLSFEIHELTEDIKIATEKTYHSTDQISFDETPLGVSTPNTFFPGTDTVLSITLDKAYGEKILSKMQDYSGDKTNFLSSIKGLYIKPSNIDFGSTVGFQATNDYTELVVNYTVGTDTLDLKLKYTDNERSFNNITIDLSNTSLNSLSNSGDTINSERTANQMFLQASTGLRTKFSLPKFDQFIAENKNVLINKVVLEIQADPTTISGGFTDSPPASITLMETENNLLKRTISDLPVFIVNEGNDDLTNSGDSYYNFNTTTNKYIVNLTLYTQEFINKTPTEPYEFIIGSYLEGDNINRAILNNTLNTDLNTTFKIYYTTPVQE